MAKKKSSKKDTSNKRNKSPNQNGDRNVPQNQGDRQNVKDSVENSPSLEKGKATPAPRKDTGEKFNAVKFFQESKEELSKVVWPSRQQLISESAAVVLMVTLVATTIYFVDNLFVWLSGKVF
ncbi:preprotein translocase subunit SecE [Spirulina sp. 06S082]|nr:preprotein translocase subunit SecE [Spirulina sp. 06S082]MEA5471159.1 preprotein translocase subunit SecE [Spirulina sp. 06S082]